MKKVMLTLWLVSLGILATTTISCSKESEGVEQSEGGGEGNENGGEGGEGGGPEAGESGTMWSKNDQADEIVKGVRLMLKFNSTTNVFEGTLENQNTVVAPLVRVEIHVFDANNQSTEFGPTPALDMQPGEIRPVSLSITSGLMFTKFNMHAEQG